MKEPDGPPRDAQATQKVRDADAQEPVRFPFARDASVTHVMPLQKDIYKVMCLYPSEKSLTKNVIWCHQAPSATAAQKYPNVVCAVW